MALEFAVSITVPTPRHLVCCNIVIVSALQNTLWQQGLALLHDMYLENRKSLIKSYIADNSKRTKTPITSITKTVKNFNSVVYHRCLAELKLNTKFIHVKSNLNQTQIFFTKFL